MSIKEWKTRHTDAWHPGDRDDCNHCQLIITEHGPMPSVRAMLLLSRYPQMADKIDPEPSCAHCGCTLGLTGDHIIPRSHGGTDDASNLQILCGSCNSRKGTGWG